MVRCKTTAWHDALTSWIPGGHMSAHGVTMIPQVLPVLACRLVAYIISAVVCAVSRSGVFAKGERVGSG